MSEAKKERPTKWLGGPIRWGKRGPSYVIERWINGTHWHVSTKCRTERAALKELEKFEADPPGYRKARTAKTTGVEVTPEMIDSFVLDMERRGLEAGYVAQTEKRLEAIMLALAGRDLSRMSFVDLRDVLDGMSDEKKPTARMALRKAIKALCKWLRRSEGKLTRQNDPSLDLVIEQAPPEKHRRRKAMDLDIVERAIAALTKEAPDVADVAIVLAATGLHISELRRAHEGVGGLYEPLEWQRAQGVLLNVAVLHKNRDGGVRKMHAVAITDPIAADAAKRVMARELFPSRQRIRLQTARASAEIGAKYSMGWTRHSVATWLALRRVPEADIAKQLGHSSTRQVRATYIDLGVGAHPVPIPRLKLVSG